MKEAELQKAIIKYLNAIGILAWRNNTGGFVGTYKGKKRFVRFGIPGAGDIFGLTKCGKFLSIEVKVLGKRPTILQEAWAHKIRENFGYAFWVDSWEAFESICRDMGWGK